MAPAAEEWEGADFYIEIPLTDETSRMIVKTPLV